VAGRVRPISPGGRGRRRYLTVAQHRIVFETHRKYFRIVRNLYVSASHRVNRRNLPNRSKCAGCCYFSQVPSGRVARQGTRSLRTQRDRHAGSQRFSRVCITRRPPRCKHPHPRGQTNSYFKNRAQISSIFGAETAIFLLKTHQRRWGASPPISAHGF
jgi:hypothetical protein